MPPVSKAQARFLFSQKPAIAARWKAEGAMGGLKGLPNHVAKAAKKRLSYETRGREDYESNQ